MSYEIRKSVSRYPMVQFFIASRQYRCSEDTNRQCESRLNLILDDWTENYCIIVTECHIEGMSGHLLQKWFISFMAGRKPNTVNHYLSFLNPFLRWAYRLAYIQEDLSSILEFARVPSVQELPEWERPKEKYLTHEQAAALLSSDLWQGMNSHRNRAIAALFLYSGIRVSELCSLTIGAVEQQNRGEIYCKRKGGKWSMVEVCDDFYPYLEAYLASGEHPNRNSMDAPLFMSARGFHMSRQLVYSILAPVQKALGIATGPHALRHTYVSEMEKLGGLTVARDLANHSNIRVTNRYDHTTKEQRRIAQEKLHWTEGLPEAK